MLKIKPGRITIILAGCPYRADTPTGSHYMGDVACIVAPALVFLRIEVGGVLFATDLCLLGLLCLSINKHMGTLQDRTVRRVCLLGLAWLAAQVLTDLVRGTPYSDFVRGWSKISLTVTHFLAVALLVRRSWKRLMLYGIGLGLGGVLTFFVAPGENATYYPWKFGFGIPVTILVCVLAGYIAPRSKLVSAAMVVAIGCLSIYLGFRSLGGVCIAVAIFSRMRVMFRRSEWKAIPVTAIVTSIGIWAAGAGYAFAATEGWLGADAQVKYAVQSAGEGGILLGGRADVIGAAAAIVDSPGIGHGSWARDPKYVALEADRMGAMGYTNIDWGADDRIPAHSHLLGAWVEAGVLGAAFWAWVLWLTLKALARATGAEPLFPFFVFIAFFLVWNILFSPYGADERFLESYSIYAMVMLNNLSKGGLPTWAYVESLHRHNFS